MIERRMHRWFAWYPVRTWPVGNWRWLTFVMRQRNEFNQVVYEELMP